jgi:apolipoprotein N-acyltransferase
VVVPTVSPQRRERRDGSGTSRRLRVPSRAFLLRCAVIIAAGLLLYVASPPRDLWWLAPIAVAPLLVITHDRRARTGFGYGMLFGLAYLLPLLGWLLAFMGAQFGPWPWLGVAAVEAFFFGLAAAAAARVSRLPGGPVWIAAVFVAAELLKDSVPFGGFPWGRLAFTQAAGPLLPLAAVGGAALVTFAVALIAAALADIGRRLATMRRAGAGRSWRGLAAPLVMVFVPVAAGLAVTPWIGTDPNAGTARVAAVQGNAPNVGLDLLYQDNVLHDNHIRATQQLADDVRAGRIPRPDFVVLPEQVGDWGPARNDPELSTIASQLGEPLIVGGLTEDANGQLHNRVVRWDPVAGDNAEYTKQHLVPFAETIPLRSIARLVTPFVDRFPQNMSPGDKPGVLDAGPARVGVGLCYDVAYDDVFRGATQAGATVLAVPTNNAWYGYSEMSYQQLAMSQLRAVENGRAVVVAATSGVSAIVRPDGTVTQQTRLFTAETVTAEVPLRSTLTLATRLGSAPTWALALLGIGAVAVTLRRRRA